MERPCFSFGKSSAMAEHCQNNNTKKIVPKTTLGGVQPHYVAIAVIDGSRWAKRFYKPGNVMKLISSYFRDSDKDRFHLTKNYYMSGQLSWK